MRQSLIVGWSLTLIQIAVACALSSRSTPHPAPSLSNSFTNSWSSAYRNLCVWDCEWYAAIATHGYRSPPIPRAQDRRNSNVAFFPAYPYLSRWVSMATGLNVVTSLLIVAQFCCFLFWAGFWLLLKRWQVQPFVAGLSLLLVFSHPAALYLVSGYSESLFLAALVLFILTSHPPTSVAAGAGFTLTATRIIGLPAVLYPVAAHWGERFGIAGKTRSLVAPLGLTLISTLGCFGFLAYCKMRFGRFDLYMLTQHVGWGITPDYAAILKWQTFQFHSPLDRAATIISVAMLLAIVPIEIGCAYLGGSRSPGRRVALYLVAACFFYVTLCGLKSVEFRSMVRYSLPWFVLIVIAWAHLGRGLPPCSRTARLAVFFLVVWISSTLFFGIQLPRFQQFLAGNWFA